MKKTGQCPKCKSNDVYTNQDISKQGERAFIMIGMLTNVNVAVYVCPSCGFIEEYIDPKSLSNPKKIAKLHENWKKHIPNH